MLKEPSKIPEPMPESLAAIKNVKVSSQTIHKKQFVKSHIGIEQVFGVLDPWIGIGNK